MMGMGKYLLAGGVLAGLFGSGAALAAADSSPVGLIMSVSGTVAPEAAPYSEVAADSRFDLGKDGKITFVHYPSCRLVTVSGGQLTFSQQDVQVEGGAVEKEVPQKCPKQLKMKIAGVAGGVRLRSIPTGSLAAKPNCALVGGRALAFASARVLKGERQMAAMKLSGAVFTWPADAPALDENQLYKLELLPKAAEDKPMALDFAVTKDAPSGPSECLLRVE